MSIRISGGATALALVLSLSQVAQAQTAPNTSSPQETTEDADAVSLMTIVITAQRREESAQDAALPISVVSEEELSRQGVTGAASLPNVAPAVQVTQGGGPATSFFVRGVGNFTNNGYSDPAVAFNYDGVYIGRPTSTTASFLDLERVEVLKGPQGTLYGRNATGGAVNVIPAKPRLLEQGGKFSAEVGDFGTVGASLSYNLPLGDRFAARFAGAVQRNEGYNDDGTSQQDDMAVRAQIYGEPTDAMNLRLSVDYSANTGVGIGTSYNGFYRYAPGTPASGNNVANYVFVPAPASIGPHSGLHTPDARAWFAGLTVSPSFTLTSPLEYPRQDNTFLGVTGEVNIETGFADIAIIPAFRSASIESLFNGPSFKGAQNDEDSDQTSLEVRLSNSAGPLDWIVGGFYFDEEVNGLAAFNQFSVQPLQNYESLTESLAFFGRGTFNLTDSFRLVGGVRYTEDKKSFDGVTNVFIEICTNAPPPVGAGCFGGPTLPNALTIPGLVGAINPADLPAGFPTAPFPPNGRPFGTRGNLLFYSPTTVDTELKSDKVTYRVAAEYDVTPDSLLYASFETGYRSGGFALALGRETFAPEFLDAYTVGSKNMFLNNRLQVNAEIFHWKYTDQQVSHFGFDLAGNNAFFTENVGSSTISGADLDVMWAATASTIVRGSVQYLNNELESFKYNTPRGGTALPPLTGCPFTNGTETVGSTTRTVYVVDCSGRQGYNSPEWSANFGVEQTFGIGAFDLVANVDGRYRGERVIGFDYLPHNIADASFTADASLSLRPADEAWSLTAYVRNVTDEDVAVLSSVLSNASNVATTNYQPPRTIGLVLGVDF